MELALFTQTYPNLVQAVYEYLKSEARLAREPYYQTYEQVAAAMFTVIEAELENSYDGDIPHGVSLNESDSYWTSRMTLREPQGNFQADDDRDYSDGLYDGRSDNRPVQRVCRITGRLV
jgi:hypothetical protein